eukprot:scaffold249499_cov27-Prasinocladus_malaysianus.AAC.1
MQLSSLRCHPLENGHVHMIAVTTSSASAAFLPIQPNHVKDSCALFFSFQSLQRRKSRQASEHAASKHSGTHLTEFGAYTANAMCLILKLKSNFAVE